MPDKKYLIFFMMKQLIFLIFYYLVAILSAILHACHSFKTNLTNIKMVPIFILAKMFIIDLSLNTSKQGIQHTIATKFDVTFNIDTVMLLFVLLSF